MRFFEVDSAVDAIMSAAMLAQTKAGSRNQQGQLSMNGFLQMLKNAGIMMDYEGFKTVYDTNPQLANVIEKFDKDTVTFMSADGNEKAVDNTKASNQPSPDERITQMARSAVRTREFKESIVKEAGFSNDMIEKLRAAYEPLRGKRIPPNPLMNIFDKIDHDVKGLIQLYKADIPFVSMMAMSRLMLKHDYKADDINKLGSIRKENFQANEDEKDDAKLMTQQLRDISEHRRMLENMIIKLAELNKSSGDLTDQLQTMFDLNTKFSAVVRRSMSIVPVYEADEPDLGRPVTGSDNHIMGSEGHSVLLLQKVAKQIAMDHADQDYTAIDELFKRTPSKELEGFLSEFGTESIEEDEKYNADSSGKFKVTFSNEDMDPKTEAQYLNVLKMLLKTYKNVNISDIDDVESYIMVRDLAVQEAAIPTSEYDYDIKKFFAKVQELEDENQHGEVAKMLTQLYGTNSELMIINGINGMHANEGSIGPEAQKLRDKISTKYYYQAEKEAKGKKTEDIRMNSRGKLERDTPYGDLPSEFEDDFDMKKLEKEFEKATKNKNESMQSKFKNFLAEGMKEKIAKDIENGMSTDLIIGKHANKRTDNTDEIRKIIKDIKFKERMKKGKK